MGWTTTDDVQMVLRVPVTDPSDIAWLAEATAAANVWCPAARAGSGYTDDPDTAPDAGCKTAATLYGATVYRERGSPESFASFEAFNPPPIPAGALGQIKRLLRVPRPQVG